MIGPGGRGTKKRRRERESVRVCVFERERQRERAPRLPGHPGFPFPGARAKPGHPWFHSTSLVHSGTGTPRSDIMRIGRRSRSLGPEPCHPNWRAGSPSPMKRKIRICWSQGIPGIAFLCRRTRNVNWERRANCLPVLYQVDVDNIPYAWMLEMQVSMTIHGISRPHTASVICTDRDSRKPASCPAKTRCGGIPYDPRGTPFPMLCLVSAVAHC